VRELLVDAVGEMPCVFGRAEVVEWFKEHYPDVQPATVTAHITAATVNSASSHYYPTAVQALIFKRDDGGLERYDLERHGEWLPDGSFSPGGTGAGTTANRPAVLQPVPGPRGPRSRRARANIDALIDGFPRFVSRFEHAKVFTGPSVYFHERAIAVRRRYANVHDLMKDDRFFEYVYAVLPSWGMHRMGRQRAKVGEFADMVDSFRAVEPIIEQLSDLHVLHLPDDLVADVTSQLWSVLGSLKVSTSATRIVAGSKALHHVLPDLVPPIDRQYTFQFFTGQKAVTRGDENAFMEWFPYIAEIGRRAAGDIKGALACQCFMATGPAKVIDNAIVGFMLGEDGTVDAGE